MAAHLCAWGLLGLNNIIILQKILEDKQMEVESRSLSISYDAMSFFIAHLVDKYEIGGEDISPELHDRVMKEVEASGQDGAIDYMRTIKMTIDQINSEVSDSIVYLRKFVENNIRDNPVETRDPKWDFVYSTVHT